MIPTTVTLLAMLSGFLSILVTIQGMHINSDIAGRYYSWAAKLIMLAMILDGLDGNLARWLRGKSEFGAELDTYVDLTAFGIAPAILVFAVSLQNQDIFWRVLLPSAVALSGVVRLARFKVKDPLRGQGGYAGLPITANATWVAIFVFITLTPPRDVFSLNQGPVAVLFLTGVFVFIVLQVTNLHYPKPTKNAAMFLFCAILVTLLICLRQKSAARIAALMMGMGGIYVVIGPLFCKGMAMRKARRETKRNE
jgi:CDP-diacylglycerol--serine O-phosphatidyltransferase